MRPLPSIIDYLHAPAGTYPQIDQAGMGREYGQAPMPRAMVSPPLPPQPDGPGYTVPQQLSAMAATALGIPGLGWDRPSRTVPDRRGPMPTLAQALLAPQPTTGEPATYRPGPSLPLAAVAQTTPAPVQTPRTAPFGLLPGMNPGGIRNDAGVAPAGPDYAPVNNAPDEAAAMAQAMAIAHQDRIARAQMAASTQAMRDAGQRQQQASRFGPLAPLAVAVQSMLGR